MSMRFREFCINKLKEEGMENFEEFVDLIDFKRAINGAIVISVAQRKGGVGKTVVAGCVARILAKAGFKVLVIDADPQGSLSNVLGVNNNIANDPILSPKNITANATLMNEILMNEPEYDIDDLSGDFTELEAESSDHKGLHDLLNLIIDGYPISRKNLRDAILTPYYEESVPVKMKNGKFRAEDIEMSITEEKVRKVKYGFDLIPSSEELTDDELGLHTRGVKGRDSLTMFKAIVDEIKKLKKYDVIVIDCPPSMNLFSLNAMYASDGSVIVGMPDKQSLFSLAKTKKVFRELLHMDENQKGILGFVLNNCRANDKKKFIIEKTIKKDLGIKFFETVIPQSAKANTASTASRLFVDLDKKIEQTFKQLTLEIMKSYYENKIWYEYRIMCFNEKYEELKNDKNVRKEIEKAYELEYVKAMCATNQNLKSENDLIEMLGKEQYKKNVSKFIELYGNVVEKDVIRNIIIKEQNTHNIWEKRTSNSFNLKEAE